MMLKAKTTNLDQCHEDLECLESEACVNHKCQNLCDAQRCGTNAECTAIGHQATCKCLTKHKGNPYYHCMQFECVSNSECATDLVCQNEKCINPCAIRYACGENAVCQISSNGVLCKCPAGWGGHPYSKCEKRKFGSPASVIKINEIHWCLPIYGA